MAKQRHVQRRIGGDGLDPEFVRMQQGLAPRRPVDLELGDGGCLEALCGPAA